MLLNINPYYTSVRDPIRFVDMIAQLKSGRSSTVTTASSQAESINEAPVPVTIITREMIDQLSNNKSIGQILAAYVPGLCEVSSYYISNLAMHGVYTASQEKILIMENGHRLNMRSTNNGKLDYAISTEKIDHIEVLRGPASSLYGNVALTAVVMASTVSTAMALTEHIVPTLLRAPHWWAPTSWHGLPYILPKERRSTFPRIPATL